MPKFGFVLQLFLKKRNGLIHLDLAKQLSCRGKSATDCSFDGPGLVFNPKLCSHTRIECYWRLKLSAYDFVKLSYSSCYPRYGLVKEVLASLKACQNVLPWKWLSSNNVHFRFLYSILKFKKRWAFWLRICTIKFLYTIFYACIDFSEDITSNAYCVIKDHSRLRLERSEKNRTIIIIG